MTSARQQRGKKARRRGLFAESLAVAYLRLKGYRVLERNWRSKLGEIDILVRKGRVLALVEVKTRADRGLASGAVLAPQRQRLMRALGHYLKTRPELAGLDLRCDVIALGRFGWPIHLRDAWRVEF
ncbi:YraN family protein [Dongia sp.]|jgi:putative endonuclease|uniref:YraN family protein n=1 Tax=Dongia sp. TaxID=1977262 RepID=UPI0035B095E5